MTTYIAPELIEPLRLKTTLKSIDSFAKIEYQRADYEFTVKAKNVNRLGFPPNMNFTQSFNLTITTSNVTGNTTYTIWNKVSSTDTKDAYIINVDDTTKVKIVNILVGINTADYTLTSSSRVIVSATKTYMEKL